MFARILPAATSWLHNIAALVLILLQGHVYASHDIADGKVVAATILLPLQNVMFAVHSVAGLPHYLANAPERDMEQHNGMCSNYLDAIMSS